MHASSASPRDAVSIYGKIPAQGDFVRVHASDPAAQSLDVWIQECLEALARAGAELPAEPVYFFHQGLAPAGQALVGALLRSGDRVGRVYPLAVFARVDAPVITNGLSMVPTAWSLFLQDAARLSGDLDRVDAALLAARARSLRAPGPPELNQAMGVCNHVLHRFATGDVLMRLFATAPMGAHYYAFKTVIDACETTRTRPPRTPIVLDCPVTSDVDAFLWLELCRRRLVGAPVVPAFLWREGAAPRLLVSLGPASGSLMRFLVCPDDHATQLWPLMTTRPDAIELARQGIAPHHRQALDTGAMPLEALLATLAR